jgi:glycosyltransferase involved in cell wall biosynthesis
MAPRPRIHCELGPVLVNRTAVYKMCRDVPAELARRGFSVHCSALLAGMPANDVTPQSTLQRSLFSFSRKWLLAACARPGIWNRLRAATGPLMAWRHGDAIRLFLDPLYYLFYNGPDRGVVIVYDFTTVSDPVWHPPGVSFLYLCAFELLALSRGRVVTSSQNTADQLRASWGIASSRLTVLPLGLFPQPSSSASPVASSTDAPFLLFVGSLEPRKNVSGLIKAFDRSRLHARHGIRLRIIGHVPDGNPPVVKRARSTPGVDLCGFVGESELADAYRHCLAFVYPSFCEGFGLPLLEAMHHGCVCLATATGSSPEVGGDAVLYVNPHSIADIARGLRHLVELSPEERQRIAEQARRRSTQFTWTRFHDGLAEVLRAEADPRAQSASEGLARPVAKEAS